MTGMKKQDKYQSHPGIELQNRQWPNRKIETTPTWCSVDLRDGNQALVNPMTLEQKLEFFTLLVEMGFKEIEVGFPSASEVEYQFCRTLIEQNHIPDDVTIQILCQAREHLIERSFEAIQGAKNVIFHLYNSTSIAQRKIVFGKNKDEITEIATQGIKWIKSHLNEFNGTLTLQYSPESFTGTEIEFSLSICEAVIKEWGIDKKTIINLPATVELFTPNIYADMIEWFCRNTRYREAMIISLHTHNDRGTGVAATELGLMAGATRVEGTLFGNGERTGNVDIITLALNLYTQGINPMLDITNLPHIMSVSDRCTEIPVHVRHPYAGELVYTAFSGSHQDAIKKGMAYQTQKSDPLWEVPYLPIDPTDVGRSYEAIIRLNSQSGKGGVAYIMEAEYGVQIPKAMQPEFGKIVQEFTDKKGKEITAIDVWNTFESTYLTPNPNFQFKSFKYNVNEDETCEGELHAIINGKDLRQAGSGNGPLDACKAALNTIGVTLSVQAYHEHALSQGSNSNAIAYVEIEKDGIKKWGAGIHSNITNAGIKAIFSALNRV
ncbi:MAG: 2-isopropylmalate synthase [bacterium]|nr:2-isopropylmalate synthase [bacterium]